MSSSRKIHTKENKKINLFDIISTAYARFALFIMFFFLACFVLALILSYFLHDYNKLMLFVSVILIMGGIILLFFLSFQEDQEETSELRKKNDNSWGKGALGEEYVEALLRKLPGNFLVINSFQTNKSGDVDHIVIAPAGVFLIETKNTSGNYSADGDDLLRNGKKVKHLRKLWKRGKYWRGAFKEFFNKGYFVPVYSCLVLLNTKWVDEKAMLLAKQWKIKICVNDYILKHLLKYGVKRRLSDEQQRQIYEFVQLMNKREQS